MPEEGFRLPGSSYEELAKIIRAYGTLTAEATPGEVSKLAAIHPTIVSRNNAFLVAIDVLSGGKKKLITNKGRNLARALDHEMPDEIRANWREIVSANEFLQKLVSAVRIRKGMEPSTLQVHVAYSAGQAKKPIVMTGAGAVVDILKAAGLVKEDEGKLVAVSEEVPGFQELPAATGETNRSQAISPVYPATMPIVTSGVTTGGVRVTIQIQIQCSADEVENLAPKLRALLKEISGPEAPENPKVGE